MNRILKNPRGFTLLELMVSMAIVAAIVGISVGGMKLGVSSREVGYQKAETYQRLRFIHEQLTVQIRSFHPLFIKENSEEIRDAAGKVKLLKTIKYLAFEGEPHSIRFVSFANILSGTGGQPFMHEVKFYLGEHPDTGETGLLLMERDVVYDPVFSEAVADSPGTRFTLLAPDVAYLDFRYYQVFQLTEQEKKDLAGPDGESVNYGGDWVDSLVVNPSLFEETKDEKRAEEKNKISMPRAVEISIGLYQPPIPGREDQEEASRLVYLPPTIVPMNSGIEYIRTVIEASEENDGTS